MSKSKYRPSRPSRRRSLRERILIVTEDSVSAPKYFHQIRISERMPEANVATVPGSGSDPVRVVRTAVEKLRRNGLFDRVFVVIDTDSHTNLSDALLLLRQFNNAAKTGTSRVRKWAPPKNEPDRERFELVLSCPCFEYWLLLHFTPWRAPFTKSGNNSICDNVNVELKKHGRYPEYEKGSHHVWKKTEHLYERHGRVNAIAAMKDAQATGRDNPKTNIYIVVDEILRLSQQTGG